ncbi:transcription elongation factor [Candidatus Methylobacter favarea]|uniref:Transcription elongation factor GreB n=1 Tax=Candidatus Methylobacter favarea TaxID=2707345 RepID=A0A8S0X6D8_9GAMM|nr:transcription elongation factor GreB [Candidatus Methylobacter favarea]CAA9888953.1 transcription elongation factor [Candidatus Methylobacter favarea]
MNDGSNLISREGRSKLENELDSLWRIERRSVVQSVTEAAAHGDRSENAEYKEGKRRLREIDRRIRFLTKRLEVLQIVDYAPEQEGKVFFGAWVELENESGEVFHYRIVGSDEFNPENNAISINSPMARALIGKTVNDEVIVHTPGGAREWFINVIQYIPFE